MSNLFLEIKNYHNLEENIKKYFIELAVDSIGYSMTRFSLNNVNCTEMISSGIDEIYNTGKEIKNEIDSIIGDLSKANDDPAILGELIERTLSLRDRNSKFTLECTKYYDYLSIYQHVFNRIENRFHKYDLDETTDEAFAQEVASSVVKASEDGYGNMLLLNVMGEVPVKLTRDRFAEYVEAAFSVYKSSDKGAFDDFVDMLRTVACLNKLSDDKAFNSYRMVLEDLDGIDFKTITSEQFEEFTDTFTMVGANSEDISYLHVCLQQMINDLYVYLGSMALLSGLGYLDEEVDNRINGVIPNEDAFDSVEEYLDSLVGRQEERYEAVLKSVALFDDGVIEKALSKMESIDDVQAEAILEYLQIISLATSGSDFMNFEKKKDNILISEGYYKEKKDEFISELLAALKAKNRMVKNAIMSNVLGNIPVFFNSIDEFKEYILFSLESCTNEDEKIASKYLIRNIINEYK